MMSDDFEELLLWLGSHPDGTTTPDRERGAEKYEKIRSRIIRIYRNRGCHLAEEIADEAIERVGRMVKRIRPNYEGDPALYFYGVAKRVHWEFVGGSGIPVPPPPPAADDPDELERRHACLDQCLAELKPASRELILLFYEGEKGEKIENRKKLAARLGITSKALSLRAMQIRRKLLDCMKNCLGGEPGEVNRGDDH